MPLNEPSWWYPTQSGRSSWQARALSPLSAVYAWAANRRMLRPDGLRAACPVICVGNFTAGGTGKTPLACWIADAVSQQGAAPAFLSRGYGGRLRGPVWVDSASHTAWDVGDEPLLLSRYGPVMVARDRGAGAEAVVRSNKNIDVIIMDDGLQNPSVKKDLRIAVVDGARGLGNGQVIPAGPLRATLGVQAALVDTIVINSGHRPGHDVEANAASLSDHLETVGYLGSTHVASIQAVGSTADLSGLRVVAFAGIGHPQRFFATLNAIGADVVDTRVFPDHHVISDNEAAALLNAAEALDGVLVTTEKDAVRLSAGGAQCQTLKTHARAVAVQMAFSENDERSLKRLISQTLDQTKGSDL